MKFDANKLIANINLIQFKGLEKVKLGTADCLFWYYNSNKKITIQELVKKLACSCFKFNGYNFSGIKDKVVLFVSQDYYSRKDHISKVRKTASSINNAAIVIGSPIQRQIDLSIIKIIYMFAVPWYKSLKKIDIGFWLKCDFIFELIHNYKWFSFLQENESLLKTTRCCISLFDLNAYDSILVQYCQSLHIPTATLQHGQYTEWEPDDKSGMTGYIYRNSLSDYFLAWGEYSKQEAIVSGIPRYKIICVGNPDYIGQTLYPVPGPSSVFGLILAGGGKEYDGYNAKLINLANKLAAHYSLKYIIKIHPGSGTQDYQNYIQQEYLERICSLHETVFSFAESVSFALTLYSTVYGELLYLKIPAFSYVPENTVDLYNLCKLYKRLPQGSFHDYQGLASIVQDLRGNPERVKKYCTEYRNLLFAPGNVADNYHSAIAKIIQDGKKNSNADIQ